MRDLNVSQDLTLGLVEIDDPAVKVIGWHKEQNGPLIQRGDGRIQAVTEDGRLATVAEPAA